MTRWKWVMLAALVLFAASAIPAGANSSEAGNTMSALDKFLAMKEAGVFNRTEEKTTRAQFVADVVKILGIEEQTDEDIDTPPFDDVSLQDWYVMEVAAAKEAGIVQGDGQGTFNPNGTITIQELAVVTANALGLEPVEDSELDGADDWAKGYIEALLQLNVLPEMSDYTEPASHDLLVDVTYEMNKIVTEQNGIGITNVDQSGVSRVSVSLNGAGESVGAVFSIARIGEDGVRTEAGIESVEWSKIGFMAIVRLSEPLQGGSYYEITLTGSDSIDPNRNSAVFAAEAERPDKLEWGGPDTLPYADNVEVPFFLLNQFGEPMDAQGEKFTLMAVDAEMERIPGQTVVRLHLTKKATPGGTIRLSVLHSGSLMTANKTYQVGESRIVSAIEIDGVPAEPLAGGASADLIVRVYDQYGGLIKDADWLNDELVVQSEPTNLAAVSSLSTDDAGGIVVRVTAARSIAADSTVSITVRARTGSASAQVSVAVKAPVLVVQLPPSSNPTVTGFVYTAGINFAYVTIETDDAARVYYYYEKKDASPGTPSASEVMARSLTDPQGGRAAVTSDQASFVLHELDSDLDGETYELFVAAADSRGRLSAVQTYEFVTAPIDNTVIWTYDESLEDKTLGRCVIMPPGAHYSPSDSDAG